MLLAFRVENCLSFWKQQEISLIAAPISGPQKRLIDVPNLGKQQVLPCAIIYGANASGKSNLLVALEFLIWQILYSHRRGDPDGGVSRRPFKLSADASDEPTFIECDFVVEGIRYTYGFECNDSAFISEWLFSYPHGKKRILFERDEEKVEFGSTFSGPKKSLISFMRPNSLFVSTATQNDHEELSVIANFFKDQIKTISLDLDETSLAVHLSNGLVDRRSIAFLEAIGTGVIDYRVVDREISDEAQEFTRELGALFKKIVGEGFDVDLENANKKAVELAHRSAQSDVEFLKLSEESAGTRRLLVVLNAVFQALDSGGVIVIDEIDASLHTKAASELARLFSDARTNRNGAQLIATTHDTNLLASDFLRRDEIWFCEKDETGNSNLYSLAEVKSRKSDNFEKGYLEGRYGAIPYSGDLVRLFEGYNG